MPETSSQAVFHARYGQLRNPHVRDLAWLLDSPDLLDPAAPLWQGRIATLAPFLKPDFGAWLRQLDAQPQALETLIAEHGFNRLGRYSELLMAFYLGNAGVLHAHGLQVRGSDNVTVGEFDFLLRDAAARLIHWEFATKFYLLQPQGEGQGGESLVGPNLADSLAAKMRKILDRQLVLSQQAAAQLLLHEAVAQAQALIKGWLFYPVDAAPKRAIEGVNAAHCHGFWRPLGSVEGMPDAQFSVLPRMRWLAPARTAPEECFDRSGLADALKKHFSRDSLPLMIGIMQPGEGAMLEVERGFIVPDDWAARANHYIRQ